MPLVDYNYNDDWLILDGFRLWSMQIDRKNIICFYLKYVNDGIYPVTLSKAQIIAVFVDFVHWDVMIYDTMITTNADETIYCNTYIPHM